MAALKTALLSRESRDLPTVAAIPALLLRNPVLLPPGAEYMAEPMMGQAVMSQQPYGMGMHMGMGDPYQGLWEPQQIEAEGGVVVKREPRWEPAYRQI
jgi:hypothetical protein